jgi:hypothetical protein
MRLRISETMSLRLSGCFKVVLLVVALAAFGEAALAQSTIFNIPTTDIVAPKKGYFEFDFLLQAPATEGASRTQVYAPRIVVGVAPNVEAGVNVFNYRSGDPSTTNSYFQPNVKWKFASSDDRGLAASTGLIWYTPINHREGADSYGVLYGNFSKKVKSGNYGPRITFGPYAIVGAEDERWVGTRAGAIVGYEQPVHSRVSIVADWFSGVSGFGYFTPGVSITLPRNGLLNIGYSLGNDSYSDPGNNNRYFFAYYGVTFP